MSIKPKIKRYRALIDLVYSDIVPEKTGQTLAKKGDITELYPELIALPDRVKLLEDLGFIEAIPDTQIVHLDKTEVKE